MSNSSIIGNIGGFIMEQTLLETNDEPIIGSEEWVVKICNEIYFTLGKGHPECVYHRALEYELRSNNVKYESEKIIPFKYKGICVGYGKSDIVINDMIIVELKSICGNIGVKELEQIGRYMKELNIDTGIIINFPQPTVSPKSTVDFVIGKMSDIP